MLDLPWSPPSNPLVVHSHCYQKSLGQGGCATETLNGLPGFRASEIDSGCCGMAGSFGYEKEHYEFSLKVGETRLFQAIRKSPQTEIVAAGFSCRSQIAQGTGRKARHLVEVLAAALSPP
jgi:Fe-S oxidoreductase